MCRLNHTSDPWKKVGYLHPDLISQSAMKSKTKFKDYNVNLTKVLRQKDIAGARSRVVTYIGECMHMWQDNKEVIIALYNLNK